MVQMSGFVDNLPSYFYYPEVSFPINTAQRFPCRGLYHLCHNWVFHTSVPIEKLDVSSTHKIVWAWNALKIMRYHFHSFPYWAGTWYSALVPDACLLFVWEHWIQPLLHSLAGEKVRLVETHLPGYYFPQGQKKCCVEWRLQVLHFPLLFLLC